MLHSSLTPRLLPKLPSYYIKTSVDIQQEEIKRLEGEKERHWLKK